MATKFSPCKGSYVLNQFPSNVMFGMNGFHVSASGAIQGHHGPLVSQYLYLNKDKNHKFRNTEIISVDQDQTAQNVQSDLDLHCLQKGL